MFKKMRRFKQQLTQEKCIEILINEPHGVLSLISDTGYPYGFPITHWYDEKNGHIYFHGAKEGRKHDLIKRNNKVSFVMENIYDIITGPQVGACECTMEFECVMGTGIIEYVSENEKVTSLTTMLRHYNIKEGKNYHFHYEVVPKIHVLRLHVNSLSAKKRKVSSQKQYF